MLIFVPRKPDALVHRLLGAPIFVSRFRIGSHAQKRSFAFSGGNWQTAAAHSSCEPCKGCAQAQRPGDERIGIVMLFWACGGRLVPAAQGR
jgi:hypothetical protein